MNWLRAFLRGVASISLVPPPTPPPLSVEAAMRADWEQVGRDLRDAMAKAAPQKCANCGYFTDHSDPDDAPDEVNGYCGNMQHIDAGAEYGGHWTHTDSWCDGWAEK